ncbi:MAG: right-handed parallel beta-helix repeat-containing protein, partial [Thermodesulfobacteriota bacterium]|nr:right-handed parallel beta-helix repeat-containing protein [Thermodesulfobacteriota bacterium]
MVASQQVNKETVGLMRTHIRGVQILKIILLTVSFTAVFENNALAETLQVPNRYLTIQEAIDASNPGDTIIVATGVYRLYSGNLSIVKKSVTLKSSYGAERTIIEGRGESPVISLSEESRAVIDGFTVTSINDADAQAVKGGGIYCAPLSSPTIVNNVITGNSAVFGGGIHCAPSSFPIIRNNIITKNRATRFGGGIFSYRASPTIALNSIVENETSNSGGGIFCGRGSPRITNNIIWKNKAKSGGGISAERSSCTIINDTITRNEAVYGGGIFFDGGSVRIINAILWNNKDDLYSKRFSPASRPDHSNIGDGDFRGMNGNISTDPLFADAENGDLRLRLDSPCIDTGNSGPIYDDP